MYNKVKVIHLLGVVLFFGSILAHTAASIFASADPDARTFFIVRQLMQAETNFLLIPGLALIILSGIAMIVLGKLQIKKLRWLTVHIITGGLVTLNALFILLPVGFELLEGSGQLVQGVISMEQLESAKNRESIFGAINVIFCLILLITGTIKPKPGAK